MALDNWIAFTFASILLTLIPGPSVLLVISQALTKGKNAAIMCILGDMIGTVVLIVLSLLGVGALLATSAVLFQIVKWAGIFYLAYLGISQLIGAGKQVEKNSDAESSAQSSWRSFWAGSITAVLNPKAIIFYMAFLTQFIDVNGNFILQMGILTLTSVIVVAVLLTGYAIVAARAQKSFQSRKAQKAIGYTGGGLMLGGSALMAATR